MLLQLPFDESISQGFLTLEKAIRAESKFNFASFGANSDDNDWLVGYQVGCYGKTSLVSERILRILEITAHQTKWFIISLIRKQRNTDLQTYFYAPALFVFEFVLSLLVLGATMV